MQPNKIQKLRRKNLEYGEEMAKSNLPKKCPLCGTKLKLPSYKCKSCNRYLTEDAVISDSGNKFRCPDCKLLVKKLSDEDIIKEYKCRDCGFGLG